MGYSRWYTSAWLLHLVERWGYWHDANGELNETYYTLAVWETRCHGTTLGAEVGLGMSTRGLGPAMGNKDPQPWSSKASHLSGKRASHGESGLHQQLHGVETQLAVAQKVKSGATPTAASLAGGPGRSPVTWTEGGPEPPLAHPSNTHGDPFTNSPPHREPQQDHPYKPLEP